MDNFLIEVISFVDMSVTDKFTPFWLDSGYKPSKGDLFLHEGKKYFVSYVIFKPADKIIQVALDSGLRRG